MQLLSEDAGPPLCLLGVVPWVLPPLLLLAQPSPHTVPAKGEHRVEVTLERFGRYAVTAKSEQGVAIRLVDKVSGPQGLVGRPGVEDGRIDAFFDRGRYRIETYGDPDATGKAKIAVHPYREANGSAPPKIVENKPVDTTLGDFEKRSYWLDIRAARWVIFEAAGRNLSDLRLWKDGTWLVDAVPTRDITEPRIGQPLTVFRLVAHLKPGLYLLCGYGGPENAWAEEDGRHPFHLRYGVPSLPSALRKRFTIGPFGYDRYLVTGADFFRIELDEARPAAVDVRQLSNANPFAAGSVGRAEVTKKTVPPVAEVTAYDSNRTYMVTVSGREGLSYVLQHFESLWRKRISPGPHWVSTIHAGHAEDSIDATGILTRVGAEHRPERFQVVEVSSDRPWGRRFNLLEEATVFLHVEEAGSYRIIGGGGAAARFKMAPFLTSRPPNWREPSFRVSGSEWTLREGLYVLTIHPDRQGVLDVTMSRTGAFFNSLKSLITREKKRRLPRPAVRFERLDLAEDDYWLYLNRQPGVRVGVVMRKLPLDLRDPLPVIQSPDEVVELPCEIREEGVLLAEAEDGARLDISVDGGPWRKSARPTVGRHVVRVRQQGEHLVSYSIGLRVRRLEPDTPLPPLPDARLAKIPAFPVLKNGEPRALDLERSSSATFRVQAGAPALFRLESTGLLATSGNLRTRTVTSVVETQENGIGRNFLIQQYLGVGDYQITVSTLGRSKGHLGLRLRRTKENRGGRLIDGVPARATLPAGQTIVYSFRIGREGRYRLRAMGQERTLRCRLEDADGWPVERVNVPASFDRVFSPGRYRLVVLPESVDVRVVTLLEAVRPPAHFTGHGPHRIPLDQVVEHVWVERDRSPRSRPEKRRRDVWTFDIPADVDVKIELTGKMHGDLIRVRPDGVREKTAYVPPLRGFSGALRKGRYRLEVLNLHQTSDLPYTVAVRTDQLVVGQSRRLRAPATLPVAVGATQLVEISSFGTSDVRASLLDAAGKTVSKSDDRPDDWNFHLARRLTPGRYQLRIDPVAKRSATTEVTVRTRHEEMQAELQVPAKKRLVVGRRLYVYPLRIPNGARFLVVVARSRETLGLVLEEDNDGWRPVATSVGRPARIELPLPPSATTRPHRLRLWSADERSLPIDLWAVALEPQPVDEEELAEGVMLKKTGALPIGVAEVKLDRPGTFRATAGRLRFSKGPARPTRAPLRGLMHPDGDRLWVVTGLGRRRAAKVRAERVTLASGSLALSVDDAPLSVDLDGDGPVLARVTAASAQPAVAILGRGETVSPGRLDVAAGAAVSVHLDGAGARARVWAGARVDDPFDATLSVKRFEKVKVKPLGTGSEQGVLEAGRALDLGLAPGPKRVRVALEEGGVAVLADASRVERVVQAARDAETFQGTGRRLLLFNPTSRRITFWADVLPLDDEVPTLSSPFEHLAAGAGRLELTVPPGAPGRRLYVRGAEEAVFLHDDGRIDRGDRFLVSAKGGAVRMRHGKGLLMAWLDASGDDGSGLFPQMPRREIGVQIPSVVSLVGRHQTLRFATEKPTVFHVRVEAPVLARFDRSGAEPRILIREQGGILDLYAEGGVARLALRPLGGGMLHGSAEVTASPVEVIGEGLGPEVMIAPGTSRIFSFSVKHRGAIGVGVRSDVADVASSLLTEVGKRLGAGVVQMHTLDPGTYLLRVASPPEGEPARARPALVGLEPPPTGPPAEVVKRYLEAAGYKEDR